MINKSKEYMLYDLLMTTCMPNFWWDDIDIKPQVKISEYPDPKAVLVDICGSFSTEKFKAQLTDYYYKMVDDYHKQYGSTLLERINHEKGIVHRKTVSLSQQSDNFESMNGSSEEYKKAIRDDLSEFIQVCSSRLYVIQVYTVEDFTAACKSIPNFCHKNRDVKLVMIDGLHFISQRDTEQEVEKRPSGGAQISAEDFFKDDRDEDYQPQPRKKKKATKITDGTYRNDCIDAALNFIAECQEKYKVCLVKFQYKSYLKGVYNFQKSILSNGLTEDDKFVYNRDENGNVSINAQAQTEDFILRRKIKEMVYNEIFLLTCDYDEKEFCCKNFQDLQEAIKTGFFTCYIKKYPKHFQDLKVFNGIYKKYLALYTVYDKDPETGRIRERKSISRVFAF